MAVFKEMHTVDQAHFQGFVSLPPSATIALSVCHVSAKLTGATAVSTFHPRNASRTLQAIAEGGIFCGVGFLFNKFCAKFLCAICSVFLRICTAIEKVPEAGMEPMTPQLYAHACTNSGMTCLC